MNKDNKKEEKELTLGKDTQVKVKDDLKSDKPVETKDAVSTEKTGMSMGFSTGGAVPTPPSQVTPMPQSPYISSVDSSTPPSTPPTPPAVQAVGAPVDQSGAAPSMAPQIGGTDPAPVSDPTDPGYTKTTSHKTMYIFIILTIVIVIALVVLFFYRQYLNVTGLGATESVTPSPQVTQTASVTKEPPTVTPVNEEEAEIQQVQLEEISNDLQDIETDVKQLAP